jgi:flagellar motor switch/type III secretory pathway protein FliN
MEPQETSPDLKSKSLASSDAAWADVMDLPCTLSVAVQIPKIAVRRLLRLELNSVLDSQHSEDKPLPVWVNGVKIGQGEFDVIGDRLIIRITETG